MPRWRAPVRTKVCKRIARRQEFRLSRVDRPNKCLSINLVSNRLLDSFSCRELTVVDQLTRECVALLGDSFLTALRDHRRARNAGGRSRSTPPHAYRHSYATHGTLACLSRVTRNRARSRNVCCPWCSLCAIFCHENSSMPRRPDDDLGFSAAGGQKGVAELFLNLSAITPEAWHPNPGFYAIRVRREGPLGSHRVEMLLPERRRALP
jgi:hypothetical protein